MLPAPGRELSAAEPLEEDDLTASPNLADACNGDTRNSSRNLTLSGGGEEQLVVFAAMQRLLQRCAVGSRYQFSDDFRADGALLAEVMQVSREAVAEINQRVGNAVLTQVASNGQSGFWIEVRSMGIRAELLFRMSIERGERERGGTKFSGDINRVAGPRPGSPKGLASWRRTDHNNVGQDIRRGTESRRLGGVAARQGDAVFFGQRQQATQKLVHPFLRKIGGDRQGEEGSDRLSAHGSNVAQAPGEAAMPDRFREVPVAPKVNPFEREVGGYEYFMPWWNTQNGSVIPDADWDLGRAASAGQAANPLNQRLFGDGHDTFTIRSLYE